MGLKKPGGIKLPELTKPASSKEIFYGYEAIDHNGELLTGSTPLVTASTAAGTPSVSGTNLLLKSAGQTNGLHIADGGTVGLITALTNLGDAAADDVLSGKTFTSSAGLKVTGNLVPTSVVTGQCNKNNNTLTGIPTGKRNVFVYAKCTTSGTTFSVYSMMLSFALFINGSCVSWSLTDQMANTGMVSKLTLTNGTIKDNNGNMKVDEQRLTYYYYAW